MKKLSALTASIAALATWPAVALGECPEPVAVQGVDTVNGSFTVSAQVEVKPVLWIANAAEDTISKIATDTNKEVARYSSAFWNGGIGGAGHGLPNHSPWDGPAPSRSAVDGDGNAYIANRGFGRVAEVMKVLTTGCIDRNGNGQCDTSSDLNNNGAISTNEMYPVKDDNANGIIEDSEIRDERVAWIKRVGGSNEVARALAIDKNGDLWVGMYNTARTYKMNATTGAVTGPWSLGVNPYGAAVDSQGRLFTAALGSAWASRIDTANPAAGPSYYYVQYGYGLALGKDHNGTEWAATAHHAGRGFMLVNPSTLATSLPPVSGYSAYGISFDKEGRILTSGALNWGTRGATKFRTDGTVVWTRSPPAGCQSGDQRGAIVDANNDIWVVSLNDHKVCKYLADGTTGPQVATGRSPYTYSDASGIGLQFSDPTGKVTFQSDAQAANFDWSGAPLCFEGGGNVTVSVAAANTEAGLGFANPTAVAVAEQGGQLCGTVPNGVTGQYLLVTFTIKTGGTVTFEDQSGECTIEIPTGNTPPTALCQDANVCANDQCVALANIDGGSSDPDGDALALSYTPAAPYGLGQTSVTLTANDGKATASCSATVTVSDCTAPSLVCPAATVAECSGNYAATVDPGQASATDNCSAVAASQPGAAAYPLGTTAVNFSATDGAGNTGTCQTSVTVVDTTPPAIQCPAAYTAECTGNGAATVTPGAASAADICGDVAIQNPGTASFPLGTTTLGYSATDAEGLTSTCSADITVVDTTKPTLSCGIAAAGYIPPSWGAGPIAITAAAADICDANLTLAITNFKATGKSGNDKTADAEASWSGGTLTIGDSAGVNTTHSWTVTATDASGNATSIDCSFTVQNPGNGGSTGSTGSKCNNGTGNGSEGCSPAQSPKANSDEGAAKKGKK